MHNENAALLLYNYSMGTLNSDIVVTVFQFIITSPYKL